MTKQTQATTKKTKTEKASSPAGTTYWPPLLAARTLGLSWFICQAEHATTQGNPRPRNTFTELEPVTFPMASSAVSAFLAAVIEAKVSGKEVPRATKVMAVIDCLSPTTHPKTVAISPTTAVTTPIMARATTKHPFPLA